MDIVDKILKSREQLKNILSNEWDTSVIQDYSKIELEKIYNIRSENPNHHGWSINLDSSAL